jgi:hypothetical protein
MRHRPYNPHPTEFAVGSRVLFRIRKGTTREMSGTIDRLDHYRSNIASYPVAWVECDDGFTRSILIKNLRPCDPSDRNANAFVEETANVKSTP